MQKPIINVLWEDKMYNVSRSKYSYLLHNNWEHMRKTSRTKKLIKYLVSQLPIHFWIGNPIAARPACKTPESSPSAPCRPFSSPRSPLAWLPFPSTGPSPLSPWRTPTAPPTTPRLAPDPPRTTTAPGSPSSPPSSRERVTEWHPTPPSIRRRGSECQNSRRLWWSQIEEEEAGSGRQRRDTRARRRPPTRRSRAIGSGCGACGQRTGSWQGMRRNGRREGGSGTLVLPWWAPPTRDRAAEAGGRSSLPLPPPGGPAPPPPRPPPFAGVEKRPSGIWKRSCLILLLRPPFFIWPGPNRPSGAL